MVGYCLALLQVSVWPCYKFGYDHGEFFVEIAGGV